MLSQRNKEILAKTGMLAGAFIVAFALLVLMVFASRGSKDRGLRETIERTVEAYRPGAFAIGGKADFKSSLSSSCAVYECEIKDNPDLECYALAMRITTFAGPEPAVFVCTRTGAQFIGYCIDNGKLEPVLNPEHSPANIRYWQYELPGILLKAGVFNDDAE